MTEERTSVLLARVETKIDNLGVDVSEIKVKLYGNGKDGLIVDQEKLAMQIERLLDITNTNVCNITKLQTIATTNMQGITTLQSLITDQVTLVKSLQEQVPQKWIVKHWKELLLAAVAFFLFIHSVIPANLSLWTFFSKIIGGP
jgi:hypothetical protein